MGKWNCELEIDSSYWIMEDKKIIAVVEKRDGNRKNANLIASAPELLEALKGMAKQYRIEHGLDGAYDEVLTMAEKAIEKAEGKS